MGRIEAEEVIAHGYECNNCGKITAKTDRNKENEGYYIKAHSFMRVTDYGHQHENTEEWYFDTKECLINFMTFGISHNTTRVTESNHGRVARKDHF